MREHGTFRLFETIRMEEGVYFLMERHLKRLSASAGHFGFRYDETETNRQLLEATRWLTKPQQIRLLLAADGEVSIEMSPLPMPAVEQAPMPVVIAGTQVNSADPFLSHKTTHRPLYDEELNRYPECADVIFRNERGEVTEGCHNNVVALLKGKLVTPPVQCGLLAGTFRNALLEGGVLQEQILTLDDLHAAEEILLINSVRGWQKVYLAGS